MAYQMNFSKEELQGKPPAPAAWYQLQIKGFRPKASALKNGETESSSWNMNCELAIINNADHEGQRVFAGLNSKMISMWPDFIHATGLTMEVVQDEFAGTEKESYCIPGAWENADTHPTDPSVWKYLGPLLNKTLEAELAFIPASGQYRAKNEIRQYKCAVPGCTDKHSTNLIKA